MLLADGKLVCFTGICFFFRGNFFRLCCLFLQAAFASLEVSEPADLWNCRVALRGCRVTCKLPPAVGVMRVGVGVGVLFHSTLP